jgi:hypothetical protein
MANEARHERATSPEDVAAKVAEILATAERDAWATIESARRSRQLHNAQQPSRARPVERLRTPPAPDYELRALLADLAAAVDALGQRVESLEDSLGARLDSLSRAPDPAGPPHERELGAQTAPSRPRNGLAGSERAERMRAVDLALRGFSRSQIAAELRSSLGDGEVERLLDEVLEPA